MLVGLFTSMVTQTGNINIVESIILLVVQSSPYTTQQVRVWHSLRVQFDGIWISSLSVLEFLHK
jgi:hypothetical protein